MTKEIAKEVKEIIKDDAYYINLISTKKATAQDKIDYATFLNGAAANEAKVELQAKIDEVKKFIADKGLTLDQIINGIKEPVKALYTFKAKSGEVFHRKDGDKGPFPKWVATMKVELTKAQALALADSDKAKKFVEKAYSK